MKLHTNLLLGALAALAIASASAAGTVTYFTGATSFQATTDLALKQYATNNGGAQVSWDNATFGKETNEIFTYVSGGNTNKIIVHWAGSENIIQALAAPASNPVTFNFFGTNTPAGLASAATYATNAEAPQAGLFDNQQTTSFFNGSTTAAYGDTRTYGVLSPVQVAAEGYALIANTNWPIAGTTNATITAGVSTNVVTYGNVTTAQFRSLFKEGYLPLAFITSNTNDQQNNIFAIGRNIDGGTRTVWFNETGLGVRTVVTQYELTTTNGSGQYYVNLSPVETIDNLSSLYAGNSGYSSDGTLRGVFTNTIVPGASADQSGSVTYTGNNYLIGYSSIHNATGSAGVKLLNYNGVVPSSANIENGTYSAWAFANIADSLTTATAASQAVSAAIESIIQAFPDSTLGAGNAQISALTVQRANDGDNITPYY